MNEKLFKYSKFKIDAKVPTLCYSKGNKGNRTKEKEDSINWQQTIFKTDSVAIYILFQHGMKCAYFVNQISGLLWYWYTNDAFNEWSYFMKYS